MVGLILVDTNIIIDFLRQKDKSLTLFDKTFHQKSSYLPAVATTSIIELWSGKSMADKIITLFVKNILKECEILYLNIPQAKLAGEILRKTNREISFADAEIAACALSYDLPLFTLNKKDFQKIKGLRLFG